MSADSKLKTYLKPHFPVLSKTLSVEDETDKTATVAQWKAWGYRVTEDQDVYGVTIRGVRYTTQENTNNEAA
jgi:hypothetical protein